MPRTGRSYPLGRHVLRRFVDDAVTMDASAPDPAVARRTVTEHWFQQWAIPPQKAPNHDVLGRRILGKGLFRDNQFNGIFADAADSLWKAKLLSDAHLQLDDGEGGLVILELPEMMTAGAGLPRGG